MRIIQWVYAAFWQLFNKKLAAAYILKPISSNVCSALRSIINGLTNLCHNFTPFFISLLFYIEQQNTCIFFDKCFS